jgi:surfactin synthase thioesterase subunit
VFHFGYGRMMPIHYGLYEDARRYDAMRADVRMPILVFQGSHDTAVSPETVKTWAAQRPNVRLHLLDDDHQLSSSLDYIWAVTAGFMGIG